MKKWYVVQIYAGYEEIVRKDIEQRVREQELGEFLGQVLVPSVKVRDFSDSEDATRDQQLFPGYLLVEVDLVPEMLRLITKTPRVLKFLGGKEPVALSQREIDRITRQMSSDFVLQTEDHGLEAGKEIEIADGPFIGFSGVIDSIDEQAEKVIVMVSIFGRMTPVELRFDQVKR